MFFFDISSNGERLENVTCDQFFSQRGISFIYSRHWKTTLINNASTVSVKYRRNYNKYINNLLQFIILLPVIITDAFVTIAIVMLFKRNVQSRYRVDNKIEATRHTFKCFSFIWKILKLGYRISSWLAPLVQITSQLWASSSKMNHSG